MTTPDMDVIKEIPGYKVILKAILKTQIQQLVEQLASTTDEESVILTASVSDGTLSHLGSDSGKNFLEDHEDIKSQFLGFCLKRHHRMKQDKEKQEKERQEAELAARAMPRFPGPSPRHFHPGASRFQSPRQPSPRGLHPVALRASPGAHMRPGMRHEPYPLQRPRRPSFSPGGPMQSPSPLKIDGQVIKIEADDDSNSNQSESNTMPMPSSSQPPSPSHSMAQSPRIKSESDRDDDAKSENSSTSTIPNEQSDLNTSALGLSLDSDLSGLISGHEQTKSSAHGDSAQSETGEMDPNVNVKIESITESEMELEITGVEPGRMPMSTAGSHDQSWAPDGQGGMMGYDPSAATGNQEDMQGYSGIPCSTALPRAIQLRGPRKKYKIYSPADRALIGRYCNENGPSATVRHFKNKYPSMNESSTRHMRDRYRETLKTRKRKLDDTDVTEICNKKRGRPLLLGDEIDEKVKRYIQVLRQKGSVISSSIVLAAAKGIVRAMDNSSLAENGGTITLNKNWAKSLMFRMNLVKRKGNTSSHLAEKIENFDKLKTDFLNRIKTTVSDHDVPAEMIINWDQAVVNIVPVSDWVLEVQGTGQDDIPGVGDRRQITAVLAATLTGEFLPPQVIFGGKTAQCHPKYKFPDNWDITHTEHRRANTETQLLYVDNIIIPFIKKTRFQLGSSQNTKALCIFDDTMVPISDEIRDHLESNNIKTVLVPACCRDQLQPMSLSVLKAVKSNLKQSFEAWYSAEILSQTDKDNETIMPVQMPLTKMKELFSQWLIKMYDVMKSKSDIIVGGFRAAGIADILKVMPLNESKKDN